MEYRVIRLIGINFNATDYVRRMDFVFRNLAELGGLSCLVRVQPIIIFCAALIEGLYHLRIVQIIVRWGNSTIRLLTTMRPVASFANLMKAAYAGILVGL